MSFKSSDPPGFAQLMDTEKYSDLKFVCEGQEIKVHKAIVCTQSSVLAAACDGGFKEAATSSINIAFDAGTVKRMVRYLYTKEYDDDASDGVVSACRSGTISQDHDNTDVENISNLLTSAHIDPLLGTTPTAEILLRHVQVNAIADYYDIPQLKQLANTKFQNVLESSWSADGFSDVIKEVFTSTTDTALRNMVTSTVVTHIEELIELEDFAALEIMGDFAISIIRDLVTGYKTKNGLSAQKIQFVESQLESTESRLRSSEQDCNYHKSLYDSNADTAYRIINNIDDCINTLSNTRKCRNVKCEADFTCYIDQGGLVDELEYTLRCDRCGYRQKSN